MPSVRYYNQTGPFWDFVADLEKQGASHPFVSAYTGHQQTGERGSQWFPGAFWGWGHPFRGGPPGSDGAPPPPPPPFDHEGPPPPAFDEKQAEGEAADPPTSAPEDDAHEQANEAHPCGRQGSHGHHGPRSCGGRRGRGGPWARGRGGWGGWGRPGRHWGGPGAFGPGGPFNIGQLAEFFQEQVLGGNRNTEGEDAAAASTEDFKPLVDVFDAEGSFVIHVSLPGANKEDVGVSWDADRSELTIAGVIHRPGDEEFLKTLALDERQVGPFERKVRLGSRANPAQVVDEAITAKMEDGILRIDVPKEDKDYVQVKKVDIE